jgi:hypothetical protein
MYRSLFDALKTKIKMHALRKDGRVGIPAISIATTNGDAAADVLSPVAKINSLLS